MVVAACLAHGMAVVYYLIVFAVIMLIGVYFNTADRQVEAADNKSLSM